MSYTKPVSENPPPPLSPIIFFRRKNNAFILTDIHLNKIETWAWNSTSPENTSNPTKNVQLLHD